MRTGSGSAIGLPKGAAPAAIGAAHHFRGRLAGKRPRSPYGSRFISSLMVVPRHRAPRGRYKGKLRTLLTWLG